MPNELDQYTLQKQHKAWHRSTSHHNAAQFSLGDAARDLLLTVASVAITSLATIGTLFGPTEALAQSQPVDGEGTRYSAIDPSFEQITVSAERRVTSAYDVPLSLTVIEEPELLRIGADHPSEILNRTPGVLIHRNSGQESLTSIRSPVLTAGAGAGSFLYLQDGVPLRAAGFANVNGLLEAHTEIADALEVIRGPSGAVYGTNAVHGLINVSTGRPGPRNSLFSISGDTIGRVKSTAILDLSDISDEAFVAFSVLDDPGFRADSGVDQQKLTLRHVFRNDRLSATTVFSGVNINQETAGFVRGDDVYLDPVLRRSNPNPEAFRDVRSARLSSRIDVELNDIATLSVTPFARWTDMEFLLFFLPSQALEANSHWSVGFQSALYLDTEKWSAIVGFDVDRTEGDLFEFQSIPTVFSFTQGLHYDYEVSAFELAPFVQLEHRPNDRLTLQAAVRLDRTTYDYDNLTDDGVVGRFLRPADRKDRFVTASPKVSAFYDLNSQLSVYATYARGARPPQTTDLYRLQINQTTDPAEPETIDSGEIGFRGRLSDLGSFSLTGYFMEKRNFFFRDADGFNVSDGKTRHVGVEAEMSVQPIRSLRIDANVSYARHTYRFERLVGGGGDPFSPSEAIVFGDDVDTAPRILAGTRVLWSPEFAPLNVEASWNRVGEYFLDAGNTETYPGHDIFDLRADYALTPSLTGFINLRNIGNRFYAERADFAFGSERYFPGEGRVATFGVRFTPGAG